MPVSYFTPLPIHNNNNPNKSIPSKDTTNIDTIHKTNNNSQQSDTSDLQRENSLLLWRQILPSLGSNNAHIVSQLNWFYQIKDSTLRQDYYTFINQKNGKRYLLFVTILYTFLAFPLMIVPFLLKSFDDELFIEQIGAIVTNVLIFIALLSGWILSYSVQCQSWLGNRLHWSIKSQEQVMYTLHHVMITCITLFFLMQLIRRMYYPICHTGSVITQLQFSDGSCLGKDVHVALILGNAIIVLSSPLFFFATMPSTRIELIWLLVIIATTTTIVIAVEIVAISSLVQYLIWVFSLVLVISDMQIRNVTIYLLHRQLEETLSENERMADELHANEMRSMIGNVAHDLKTVSAFTFNYCNTVLANPC